jgi:hypothetical protein
MIASWGRTYQWSSQWLDTLDGAIQCGVGQLFPNRYHAGATNKQSFPE